MSGHGMQAAVSAWQHGSSLQQCAQSDMKAVLTGRSGQVALQDLPAAWLSVHQVPLDVRTYGASHVMEFVDMCRSICWYERLT